jgi:hypothetical protein
MHEVCGSNICSSTYNCNICNSTQQVFIVVVGFYNCHMINIVISFKFLIPLILMKKKDMCIMHRVFMLWLELMLCNTPPIPCGVVPTAFGAWGLFFWLCGPRHMGFGRSRGGWDGRVMH